MRFPGVRAVFFDVDDTLYDFEDSMALAFRHLRKVFPEILGRHGEDRLSEAYWRFYRGYPEAEKLDLISRDPDLFRRTMWAGALVNLGVDRDEALLAFTPHQHAGASPNLDAEHAFVQVLTAEFQRLRHEHWRASMYPGARELIDDLLRAGFVLGAITNGPSAVQRPKLEALSYLEWTEEPRVFVSGEFGVRKPDPSIFRAAARAAGVAPEACLMVGDAREYDMPAKAIGFRTVLFDGKARKPDTSADPFPPDARVQTYAELRRLLLS